MQNVRAQSLCRIFGQILAGSFAAFAAFALQACSLEARRTPLTLRLDLTSIKNAIGTAESKPHAPSQAFTAPTGFSDLTCLGVNVASDLIAEKPMPQNLRFRANIQPQRFSTVQSLIELNATTLALPVIETQITVPNNIGLTVQLWGIKTEFGGCPGVQGRETGRVAVYALGQKAFLPTDLSTVVDFGLSRATALDLLADSNRVFDEIFVGFNPPATALNSSNYQSFAISGPCSETGQAVMLRLQGGTLLAQPTCSSGAWAATVNLSPLAQLAAGPFQLAADHGDGGAKRANTALLTINWPGPAPAPSPSPSPSPSVGVVGGSAPNVYYNPNTFVYRLGDAVSHTPYLTGGAITTCQISPAFPQGSGLSFDTTTCAVTGTAAAPMAQTTFSITPSNAAGTASVAGQLTLTINLNPPIINFSPNGNLSATVGTAMTAVSPTNTGGPITTCSVSPPFPGGMTLSPTCQVGGTPQVPSSQTFYTITATNAGGSAQAGLSITVLAANQSPTLLYGTATTSNPISHTSLASLLGAADPEADLISFEIYEILSGGLVRMVSGVPTTLTAGDRLQPNGNVDWTPPSGGAGTGPAFRVRAFDGQSYSSTIADVYVTAAAQTSTPASGIAFKPGTTRRSVSVPVFVGSCGTASHVLISESTTQPVATAAGWQPCTTSTTAQAAPLASFTWDPATNGASLADWSNGSRNLYVWTKTQADVVSSTPVSLTIPAHGSFASVSASSNETCAAGTDNRVYCWGDGQGRELPVAETSISGAFALTSTSRGTLREVASGKDGGCVLIDAPPAPFGDGKTHAVCAGLYLSSSGNNQSAPVFVEPVYNTDVAQVAVSRPGPYASPSPGVTQTAGHACVLTRSGPLYCWGDNSTGQVNTGAASTTPVTSLMAITAGGSSGFSAVSAGSKHTCAITGMGALYCWGDGTGFGLGSSNPSGPVRLSGDPASNTGINYTKVFAGDRATCGIDTAGRVHCWGTRQVWNTGTGSYSNQTFFEQLTDAVYMSVTVGPTHTCALTTAGLARCWGENDSGQLGAAPSGQYPFVPASAAVVVTGTFSQITAGNNHTCGLTPDRRIQCWGANWSGQLGQGNTSAANNPGTPVEINMVTAWSLAMNQNLWNLTVPEGEQATTTITLANRFDLPASLMPQSLNCSATPNQYGPGDPLAPTNSSNATRLYLGAAGCTCSGLSCSFSLTATAGSGSNYPGLWINQGVEVSINNPGSSDPVTALFSGARITPSTYCAGLGYGLSQAGHCISAWGLKNLGNSWITGWLGNQVPPDDGSAWVAVLGPVWDEATSTQLYPDRLATFASRDWARLWMLGGRLDVTPGTYLHVLATDGWVNSNWSGNSSSLNVFTGATVTGLPATGLTNLNYCNQSATSATGAGYCPGSDPLFATVATQSSCSASQGFQWRSLATDSYCSKVLELPPKTVGAFTASETQKTESFYGWATFSTNAAPSCALTGASTGINLGASTCSCYPGALNCSVTAVAASTLTRPNTTDQWVSFVVSLGGYSVASRLTIQAVSGGTLIAPSLDYGTGARELFAGVLGQFGPVSVSSGWAAPTSCTASPPLPTGLSIDPQSCLISGTPVSEQASATYTITASNAAGSATASFSLLIRGQLQILPKLAATDFAIASADAGNQIRLGYLNAAEPASFSVLSGEASIQPDGLYQPGFSYPNVLPRRSTATVQVSDELSRTSTLNIKNIPVRVNGPVYATALSSDGAYAYLGGSFSALNPYLTPRLAVLDEGTGDLSPHGCNFQNGFDGQIQALAISGGYAYVGGQFTKYRGQATAALAKVRLDTCEIVATFNKGFGAGARVNAIAVTGSGVFVGGNFTTYGGSSASYLVKLDATTGDPSSGFAATLPSEVNALLWVPGTGAVFVGLNGGSTNTTPLRKVSLTTGAQDATFTPPSLGTNSVVWALAYSPTQNRIFAGGSLNTSAVTVQSYSLASADANTGAVDATFATKLNTYYYLASGSSVVKSLAVVMQGTTPWLYAGASGGTTPNKRLSRIDISGSTTKGTATASQLMVESVDSLLPSPDGGLYAGGSFNFGVAVNNATPNYFFQGFVKLDPATLAPTTGMAIADSAGFNGRVLAMAREEIPGSTLGRLWVGGDFFTYRGAHASNLARVELATGWIEAPSHCGSGSGTDGPVKALALSGSSIFVGGAFANYCGTPGTNLPGLAAGGLLKLSLPATAPDPWYADPDMTFHTGTGANAGVGATPVGTYEVSALSVSPDGGSVFAGGTFVNYRNLTANKLVKLDATTGARDTTFYPIASPSGMDGPVYALAASADGNLFAGGAFTHYTSPAATGVTITTANYLAKINSTTGALNTTFTSSVGANAPVYSLALGTDGLFVGGNLTMYRNTMANRLAKVDPITGAPVAAFSIGTGFSAPVTTLALSGTTLYVGGSLGTFQGSPSPGLAKLNATTGQRDTTFRSGTLTSTSPTDFVPACMAVSNVNGGTLVLGGTGLEHRGELAPYFTTINVSNGQFND